MYFQTQKSKFVTLILNPVKVYKSVTIRSSFVPLIVTTEARQAWGADDDDGDEKYQVVCECHNQTEFTKEYRRWNKTKRNKVFSITKVVFATVRSKQIAMNTKLKISMEQNGNKTRNYLRLIFYILWNQLFNTYRFNGFIKLNLLIELNELVKNSWITNILCRQNFVVWVDRRRDRRATRRGMADESFLANQTSEVGTVIVLCAYVRFKFKYLTWIEHTQENFLPVL